MKKFDEDPYSQRLPLAKVHSEKDPVFIHNKLKAVKAISYKVMKLNNKLIINIGN